MLELHTLGQLDLRVRGGPPMDVVLAQPKRCALLAYLALASPSGFSHREVLLSLFWPEMDAPRARRALRQSVFFLRRSLGHDVLRSRGDAEVGVDGKALWCDAVAFRAAAHACDWRGAEALYRGDLLPGVFVEGSPEFERWLDQERARLREDAAQVLWHLVDSDLVAGDAAGAAARARRAAALAADDETVLRRLLLTLERAGDGAAAAQAYEVFARRLAAEYELEPSAETRALAARIRAAPFVSGASATALSRSASVGEGAAPSVGSIPAARPALPLERLARAGVERPGSSRPGLARTRFRGQLRVVIAAVVVVTGLAVFAARRQAEAALNPDVFAVVPFGAVGADSAFWSEAVVHLLGLRLDGVAELRHADVRTVLRASGSASVPATGREAMRIARRAGARHVLMGRVVSGENSTLIAAEVWDAGTGARLGSVSVQGRREDPAGLIDRLADGVLTRTGLLGDIGAVPSRTLGSVASGSLEALRAWLSGERHFRRSSFRAAYDEYTRAVEWDSTFALAHLRRWQAAALADLPYTEPWPMQASRYAARLAPRERQLVRILTEPLASTTIAPLERLVGQYPEDAELLYQLADRYYHERIDSTDVRFAGALTRVLAIDPSFAPAYLHLIEHAFAHRDRVGALRLLAGLGRVDPHRAREFDLAVRLAFGAPAARQAVLAGLDSAATEELLRALRMVAVSAEYRPARLALAGALAAPRHPPAARALAHATIVSARLASGELDSAFAAFAAAEPILPAARAVILYHLLWQLADSTVDVLPADAAAAEVESGIATASQRYLLAAYAARRGQGARFAAQQAALQAMAENPLAPELYRRASELAERALRAGTAPHGSGAADSMLAVLAAPGVWAIEDAALRLWQATAARLLLEEGRPAEALVILETLSRTSATVPKPIDILRQRGRRALDGAR